MDTTQQQQHSINHISLFQNKIFTNDDFDDGDSDHDDDDATKQYANKVSTVSNSIPQNNTTKRPQYTKQKIWFYQPRTWLYKFLQQPSDALSLSYHTLVICLILLALFWFALSTVANLSWWASIVLKIFDFIIFTILVVEYILLLLVCTSINTYHGCGGWVRFLLSPSRIINLLLIGITAVVIWTCWLSPHQSNIYWLRVGQVCQCLRLEPRYGSWKVFAEVMWSLREQLLITAYTCFLSLMVISAVVYFIEQPVIGTMITNIPKSIWWGVVTAFGIGYGDTVPVSTAGKIVAAIIMLFTCTIWMLPSGIISAGIALKVQENARHKHGEKRREPAAKLIQIAWRRYITTISVDVKQTATWRHFVKLILDYRDRHSSSTRNGVRRESSYSFININLVKNGAFHLNDDENHNFDDIELDQWWISKSECIALRWIIEVRFRCVLRQFRQAKKPYDLKDVLHKYLKSHANVIGRVRQIQKRLTTVENELDQLMSLVYESQQTRSKQVDHLEQLISKLDECFT